MTGIQKLKETTIAKLTLVDADATTEGVDHYNVFVALNDAPGTDPTVDKYQSVSTAGTTDINLSSLNNGGITPGNGDEITFTVVAVDATNHASIPGQNDSTTVTWDIEGPTQPAGLTLVDNLNSTTMTYSLIDQSADEDLDHFEVYFSKGEEPTLESYGQKRTNSRTFREIDLVRGPDKILDLLGVINGDVVFITVYAVDKFGNRSEPAKVHATYSALN